MSENVRVFTPERWRVVLDLFIYVSTAAIFSGSAILSQRAWLCVPLIVGLTAVAAEVLRAARCLSRFTLDERFLTVGSGSRTTQFSWEEIRILHTASTGFATRVNIQADRDFCYTLSGHARSTAQEMLALICEKAQLETVTPNSLYMKTGQAVTAGTVLRREEGVKDADSERLLNGEK